MTPLWVALAVVIDGAAALIGGLVPERLLVRHRPAMLGFATGALLATATLDLIPEALAARQLGALPWLLGGVLGPALVEWVIAPHEHAGHRDVLPVALLGSDALHNFGDGLAIAAAFVVSPRLGAITSLAVVVHEVPEEVADYAILREQGMSKTRSLLALAIVQLTAGLGALATLLGERLEGFNGIVLAIAAGTFVYIATVDLLPHVVRSGPRRDRVTALVGLALGVAIIVLVS